MLSSVRESAPAKINFNLKVLPKRDDGFHDIESIFQTIPLCDELLVEIGSPASDTESHEEMVVNSNSCTVSSANLSLPSNNTLTMAYDAFCSLTGWSQSVHVTLTKHIPSGGGLGGGSSDAAAMIRALEKLSGITLTDEQLFEAASRIGSDVFFFLLNRELHTAALVTGRGERVKYIEPRSDLFIVLVCPPVHSSTPEAYRLVDQWNDGNEIGFPLLEELEAVYNGPIAQWTFRNSFTKPLSGKYPELQHVLQNLLDAHAMYAEMSGSGSVIFGVFESMKQAQLAANSLVTDAYKVHLVCSGQWQPVAKSGGRRDADYRSTHP